MLDSYVLYFSKTKQKHLYICHKKNKVYIPFCCDQFSFESFDGRSININVNCDQGDS